MKALLRSAACLIALLPLAGLAQVSNMGMGLTGKVVLLGFPAVKKEVKLTADQDKAIQKVMSDAEKDPSIAGFPDMHYLTRGLDIKAVAVLDEGQRARLQQIWLQANGPLALSEASVADALGLSDEAKASIKGVSRDFDREQMNALMESRKFDKKAAAKRREDAGAKIFALLTPDQVEKWKAMLGEPFKFPRGIID